MPLSFALILLISAPASVGIPPCGALSETQDPRTDKPGQSLEDLLRAARLKRSQLLEGLRGKVQGIVTELETATPRIQPTVATSLRTQLTDLGPQIAPLLLGALNPGANPSRGARFRATEIVTVLRELQSAAIGNELVASSQRGPDEGRINALRVLANFPAPDRVMAGVRQTHGSATGGVRTAALITRLQLGDSNPDQLLAEALLASPDPSDPERTSRLLTSLAGVQCAAIAPSVAKFLASESAPHQAAVLVTFYRVRNDLLSDQDHLLGIIELASHADTARESAVGLLESLADFDIKLKGEAKRRLSDLQDSTMLDLRESALILLARSKDKNARRVLTKDYDNRIKSNRTSSVAHAERGEIFYRIGEYQSSIKDFKNAISLQRGLANKGEAHIGIARCYARLKRYSDAAEYLGLAPVSMTTLRQLASDPAFARMLETKYRDAFHLPD